VISLNADKQGMDYARNVVFLGADDNVPEKVVRHLRKVVGNQEVVFIYEDDFASSRKFFEFFGEAEIKTAALRLNTSAVNDTEKGLLFEQIGEKLKGKTNPIVVINTHSNWGVEIVNYIDQYYRNVTMLGGPYIVNWTARDQGPKNEGNNLMRLTVPADSSKGKTQTCMKELRRERPDLVEIANAPMYVKRLFNAMAIVRGVYEGKVENGETGFYRSDFVNFFDYELRGRTYEIGDVSLKLDDDLVIADEKVFENYSAGRTLPARAQTNEFPSFSLSMKLKNVSHLDVKSGLYKVMFEYMLVYDKKFEDKEKLIRITDGTRVFTPASSKVDEQEKTISKVYQVTDWFEVDVDSAKYPFDTQEIKLNLQVQYPADQLTVVEEQDSFRKSVDYVKPHLDSWRVIKQSAFVTTEPVEIVTPDQPGSILRKNQVKKFTYTASIQRRWTTRLMIVLPIIIIGVVAIVLMYVKDKRFSSIGGFCGALVLCMITYSSYFSQSTPSSDILTVADKLFYVALVSLLAMFLTIVAFNSVEKNSRIHALMTEKRFMIGNVILALYSAAATAILFSPLFDHLIGK
jgi:hypothetical protein